MEDSSQKVLRKRKPFRLLAKFDRREVELFRQFLEWPLVNAKPDQKLLEFFDYCDKIQIWHIDIDKAGFQGATAMKLSDNAFDKLVSKLYTQLTTFAGLMEFLDSTQQHPNFALKFYEKKGVDLEEIGKKVREGKRELSGTVQDESYFRMMLELELETIERFASRAQSPEERGLPVLHGHLDSYFAILKLRFLCASANEERIYGNVNTAVFDPSLQAWFHGIYPQMPTLSKVYYHAYHILKGVEEHEHSEAFRKHLKIWETHSPEARGTEFGELNSYLLNHYLRKLNSGEPDALPNVLHTYLEGLKKGWLLEEGKLLPEHFKNIMVTHCRMGLLTEARVFFETYQAVLSDPQGGAAIAYNEAVLEVYEKRYVDAIEKLETMSDAKGPIKADQYYGIDLRLFLFKAYFEYLGVADWEQWDLVDQKLQSILHAFPSYLARKDLPKMKQVRFENYRKAIMRLYGIAYGLPDSERSIKAKELLLDFRSSSNLPDKGWFIQKAQELITLS